MRIHHKHYTPVSQAVGFGDLWTPPSVPVETSEQAAVAIQPHLQTLRAKVYDFIRARGAFGATADECEAGTGLKGSTVRPRLLELELVKRIKRTQVTRMTRSGRRALVWCACEFASTPSCAQSK